MVCERIRRQGKDRKPQPMTNLETGAAGFSGMAVADRLLSEGRAVFGIDNMNDYYPVSLKRDRIAALHQRHGGLFTFAELDFADMDALHAELHNHPVEPINHLGAQAGDRRSLTNPHSNVPPNLPELVNNTSSDYRKERVDLYG